MFQKLTIKQRLYGVAFALVAAILFTSALLLFKLNEVESDFATFETSGVNSELLVLKINRDVNYTSRLTRSIMLGDDYQSNFAKLEQYVQKISGHFKSLKASASGLHSETERKTLLAVIDRAERETFAFLNDGVTRMRKLGSAERTPEVLAAAWKGYKTEASPLAKTARKSFGELIEMQESIMAALRDSTSRDISGIQTMILIAAGGMLAFTLITLIPVARFIIRRAEQLREGILAVEEDSDLTRRLEVTGQDELTVTSRAFNNLLETFQQSISRLSAAAGELSDSASSVAGITANTTKNLAEQEVQTDLAATAMNEMTATVQEVSANAVSAAEAAGNADNQSRQGQQVVSKTVSGINALAGEVERASEVITRLEQDTEEIGKVLDVIKGIAEQTNLLALNAAIEAARAGEQGRGFAVVADEVRTLASRTQQSTEEIHDMIERLQSGAGDAVKVMAESRNRAGESVDNANAAGEALSSITSAVREITEMNTRIATAANEQSTVADEINRSIISINQGAQENAAGAEQAAQANLRMQALAEELKALVSSFRA